MSGLVRIAEGIPLSSRNIMEMLHGKPEKNQTKIMAYDDLSNFNSLASAFGSKKYLVLLFKLQGRNVGHWIVLINFSDHYEHFDPYGIDIDHELSITHEGPILSNLISRANKRVISNSFKFQRLKTDVNTCARWCVTRILMSSLTLDEYKSFIFIAGSDHDSTVTLLTYLLS